MGSGKFVSFKRQKLDTGSDGKVEKSDEMTRKYGIGAKLLAQMGYVAGKGLGSDGRGIARPIEAVQRPDSKVGLGMLSSVSEQINRHDYDLSSSEDELVSSSDDDIISNEPRKLPRKKSVQFSKTGTVSLNDSERLRLISRLKDLENNDKTVSVSSRLLNQIKTQSNISKQNKLEILDIVQRLEHIQSRLESLDLRIPMIKQEQEDLTDSNQLLVGIGQYVCKQESAFSEDVLRQNIDHILQLLDDDMMDSLMAKFLKQVFNQESFRSDYTWLLKENLFEKCVLPIIETLQYRIDDNVFTTHKLNKTQTEIFQVLFPAMTQLISQSSLEDTNSRKTMIMSLVDYEAALKYIGCYDCIIDKSVMPKIDVAIYDNWDIGSKGSNISWLLDVKALLPPEKMEDIRGMIRERFGNYCVNWYYRDPLISKEDTAVVRQLLNEDEYYEIIRKEITCTLEKFVTKYFDLDYDMSDINNEDKPDTSFDSIYVFIFIKGCQYLLYPTDYETFICSFFNKINKFIFDWIFYYGSDPNMRRKANSWFNWFINKVYCKETLENNLSYFEITKIRESKYFLEHIHDDTLPIHNEDFSLSDSLVSSCEQEGGKIPSSKDNEGSAANIEYTVDTLPLRKVTVSFKDVVQDYCLEKGYTLQKSGDNYTELSFGPYQSMLVPVYQVKNGLTQKDVAIKDNILWVENGQGGYVPTYLSDFKL